MAEEADDLTPKMKQYIKDQGGEDAFAARMELEKENEKLINTLVEENIQKVIKEGLKFQ